MTVQVITNEIKRKRIINQYKAFYTLYYEAVERQSTKPQEREGSVVNVTSNQKELILCPQK